MNTDIIPPVMLTATDIITGLAPGSILAGGALRDTFGKVPVKDLDFFVPAETDHEKLKAGLAEFGWSIPGPKCNGYLIPGSDGTIAETYTLRHMSSQYTLQHVRNLVPEVNIITMALGWNPMDRLDSFDFGICQIAFDGDQLYHTEAFSRDMEDHTFTLIRSESTDQFKRSMQRYLRLSEKYPGWTLIVPSHLQKWADNA